MLRPLVFALVLALSAIGAWADMYDDCKQSAEPDLRIRGCTQVIGRGEKETRKNLTAAYYNRGRAYEKKGEVDHAIADYDKAIALERHLAPAYFNRGNAYYSKGKLDHAITDFHKAIAFHPNYAPAYYNRGRAYEKKGDKEQAIADFRKALEINPSDQDAKEGLKRLGVTP
jgi:tetratricopeptide (TPR) repeat protein